MDIFVATITWHVVYVITIDIMNFKEKWLKVVVFSSLFFFFRYIYVCVCVFGLSFFLDVESMF